MADYLGIGIESIKDIFTYLNHKNKSKDILRNNLMREIRDNLKLLEHRNSKNVEVVVLIQSLFIEAIETAYKENYPFDKLTSKRKLEDAFILHKRLQIYSGWTTSKFFYSIEGKIKDLKNIPNLYKDLSQAPVNMKLRLDNLFYQLLQLSIFIQKQGE